MQRVGAVDVVLLLEGVGAGAGSVVPSSTTVEWGPDSGSRRPPPPPCLLLPSSSSPSSSSSSYPCPPPPFFTSTFPTFQHLGQAGPSHLPSSSGAAAYLLSWIFPCWHEQEARLGKNNTTDLLVLYSSFISAGFH